MIRTRCLKATDSNRPSDQFQRLVAPPSCAYAAHTADCRQMARRPGYLARLCGFRLHHRVLLVYLTFILSDRSLFCYRYDFLRPIAGGAFSGPELQN